MSELRDLLDRRAGRLQPAPDALERVLRGARRRHRNRRIASAVVALAVFAGAAAGLVSAFTREPEPTVPGPTGFLEVPLEGAGDVAIGEGAVWVARATSNDPAVPIPAGEIVRLDPATGEVLARIPLDQVGPLAVGEGSVWVANYPRDEAPATLLRIDPTTNSVSDVIDLPLLAYEVAKGDRAFLPNDVAVGFGRVWVSTARGTVVSIDPGTGEAVTQDGEPATILDGLAVGAGSVWTWSGFCPPYGAVLEIDPITGRIEDRLEVPGLNSVAADDRFVWISHDPVQEGCPSGTAEAQSPVALTRFEPSTDATTVSEHWPTAPGVLAAADGTGYLGDRSGRVWAVDDSGTRLLADLATPVWAIAVEGDALWVVTERGLVGVSLRTGGPTPPPGALDLLVYASQDREFRTDLFLVRADGSGLRNLTNSPETYETDAAWSPDGTRIAFSDGRTIWVIGLDGSLTRLTAEAGGIEEDPAWSPDGTRIAFTRQEAEGAFRDIAVMNADGTGLTVLTGGETDDFGPTWSPDGGWIAFARGDDETYGDIWKIRADGTDATRLTSIGGAVRPAWSPDGQTIAFDVEPRIWVVGPDGSDAHPITDPEGEGRAGSDVAPAWSPDGTRIAFVTGNDIWVVSADGSDARPVVTGPANDYSPAWRPSPSLAPTPTTPALVGRCVRTETTGDFDGDGSPDRATLFDAIPAGETCRQDISSLLRIRVDFATGRSFEASFSECQGGSCSGVFEATDLDGDGRSELAIEVGPGAAVDFVEFFRVNLERIVPLSISAPGAPEAGVRPGSAILGGGFDSGAQSPVACELRSDGSRVLVSIHASPTGNLTDPWRVVQVELELRGDDLHVIDTFSRSARDISIGSPLFTDGCER
jgi:TolB protein